jgi:hypothetical protein
MIHYNLVCEAAHEFDGWFPSIAAFDTQAKRGFVVCPQCGSNAVKRALMAPGIPKKGAASRNTQAEAAPALPAKVAMGGEIPAAMLAQLQRMRAEIEARCDYVGDDFANEARRIHNGESERTGIYGEATREEAEALQDDGINVASIPWVKRADG